MSRLAMLLALVLAAAASHCDDTRSTPDHPKPGIGDSVRLRGTIAEDVDCPLLRLDDGTTFSLTGRVPRGLRSGERVCVGGTVVATSQCLTQPTIEVESLGAWSSCP
ncbi:MAG TPA: DUF5818 domain-containing protein [Dongiaceae bacterium]|nr:DUF5818 domain-containing protein [Dongiaceae bacterium]